MTYREKDIVHENAKAWVLDDHKNKRYTVFCRGITCSESDSSYERNEDGLSIAIARSNYFDRPAAFNPAGRHGS